MENVFRQKSVAALEPNTDFEGFLLVKNAQQRTSEKTQKVYLDLTLMDKSGEISCKKWDGQTPAPESGKIVKVRGKTQEFNGRTQLNIQLIRDYDESRDVIDMEKLMPCAPFPAEDMYGEILAQVNAIHDTDMRELVLARLDECGEAIMTMPAALKLHHAERSGLLHHTSTMLKGAQALCAVYPQLDRDLLTAGIVLHDLCKIDEMNTDALGLASEYSTEGQLLGHITMGVRDLHMLGTRLGTDHEKLMLLEHMILSHHDLPEFGSPKPPMFPEAEVLHTLDMLDARLFEMDRALSTIRPGAFTEKIWSLDRRLYKRSDAPDVQD